MSKKQSSFLDRESRRDTIGAILETTKKDKPKGKRQKITIGHKYEYERKTRRKSLLLKPSTHDKALEICKNMEISFNDVVQQLLDEWIEYNGK